MAGLQMGLSLGALNHYRLSRAFSQDGAFV
jgi:hypothetical protein